MFMSDSSQELLSNYLNSDSMSAGCLDYTACHGFMTALAVRDDDCNTNEIIRFIIDAEPKYQSSDEKHAVVTALSELFTTLNRELYLGESLTLPHDLSPSKPDQTNELTDWCFGFMEAIAIYEEHWFGANQPIDAIAELILPLSIFSEPHVEPGLAHLVQTAKARASLAAEIPDNLQQLYLLFRD